MFSELSLSSTWRLESLSIETTSGGSGSDCGCLSDPLLIAMSPVTIRRRKTSCIVSILDVFLACFSRKCLLPLFRASWASLRIVPIGSIEEHTMFAPCNSRTWTLTGILNHGYSCTWHLAVSMQYCPKGSGSMGSLHEIAMSIVRNLCTRDLSNPQMSAKISSSLKALRAVLPSFVLPAPCCGSSTFNPSSALNRSWTSFFFEDNRVLSSSDYTRHFLILILYAMWSSISKHRIHLWSGESPYL